MTNPGATSSPQTCASTAPEQVRFAHLVGRLTHDIRAPVRAMVELSHWIAEEIDETDHPKSSDLDQYITLLQQRGARLEGLITSLMVLAQVGQDRVRFDGNWRGLLGAVLRQVPQLQAFELDTDFRGVPDVARSDLQSLFTVLLANATTHHHLGRGRLVLTSQLQPDGCRVIVEDDGPGIAIADRKAVLEMFATRPPHGTPPGSGLGLSIAKHITDHSNGRLHIDAPENGQGCRVSAWFPTAPAPMRHA